jgi:hypothetical protein
VDEIDNFAKAVAGLIVYEDGQNAWCNTILTDRYPRCYAGLPAGIGVSIYFRLDQFPTQPRSKYLLISTAQLRLLQGPAQAIQAFPDLGGRVNEFASSSPAVLAINPLAECGRRARR